MCDMKRSDKHLWDDQTVCVNSDNIDKLEEMIYFKF